MMPLQKYIITILLRDRPHTYTQHTTENKVPIPYTFLLEHDYTLIEIMSLNTCRIYQNLAAACKNVSSVLPHYIRGAELIYKSR